MSRVVIKTAQGPYKLMTQEGEKKICMCGLSKNQPFCDGSHHKTEGEVADTLYQYDDAGNRSALEEDDEDCCCCSDEKCGSDENCCGEGCCSDEECKDDCCSDEKCGCGCDCEDEAEVTEKAEPQKSTHTKG